MRSGHRELAPDESRRSRCPQWVSPDSDPQRFQWTGKSVCWKASTSVEVVCATRECAVLWKIISAIVEVIGAVKDSDKGRLAHIISTYGDPIRLVAQGTAIDNLDRQIGRVNWKIGSALKSNIFSTEVGNGAPWPPGDLLRKLLEYALRPILLGNWCVAPQSRSNSVR